jgi:hypothetical protein
MMNWNYKELLPDDFAADSRVWVYQGSRLFSMSEALQIEDLIQNFVTGWQSHGIPVKGFGNLFFGQFIVLMADEHATGVSGCSTDSSVRLIKSIEQAYQVNMFDRLALAFVAKEKIQLVPLPQLQYAIDNNSITPETLYFNNLVQNKEALENNWLIPLKDSWLAKRIVLNQAG